MPMATPGKILLAILFLAVEAHAQQWSWQESQTGADASLRGLCVVGETTLWASGSGASVLRSTDGGSSWKSCGPKGFDKLEFRSLVANSERHCLVASAGTPAVILETEDGGDTWIERYRHTSPHAFLDGLKFWDHLRGIAFGDPVEGVFMIVTTQDGGRTWSQIQPPSLPQPREQEAAFAASNSSMIVGKNGQVWIGTGGTRSAHSRILFSEDFGLSWAVYDCPIPSNTTEGIFALQAGNTESSLFAFGGDYRALVDSKLTAAFSSDAGKTWQKVSKPPSKFVSAAAIHFTGNNGKPLAIAVGPESSFVSENLQEWIPFSETGFHAIASTNQGRMVAVGSGGRFGVLTAK